MNLPKCLIYQISGYLPISDLAKLRQTNSKLNSTLSDNSFWRQRLKQDFDLDMWVDTCGKLYQNLYLGHQILSEKQIYDFETFESQQTTSVINGLVVVCWCEQSPEYWTVIEPDPNMRNKPIHRVNIFYKDHGRMRAFYIAANQIASWNLKFQQGRVCDPRMFAPYRQMKCASRWLPPGTRVY